jgi:hypothetical protein
MPGAPRLLVEILRVGAAQVFHEKRDPIDWRMHKQVHVVAHQTPRIQLGLRLFERMPQNPQERLAVIVVFEYDLPTGAACDDMVQIDRAQVSLSSHAYSFVL